jgi:hypothetical protein
MTNTLFPKAGYDSPDLDPAYVEPHSPNRVFPSNGPVRRSSEQTLGNIRDLFGELANTVPKSSSHAVSFNGEEEPAETLPLRDAEEGDVLSAERIKQACTDLHNTVVVFKRVFSPGAREYFSVEEEVEVTQEEMENRKHDILKGLRIAVLEAQELVDRAHDYGDYDILMALEALEAELEEVRAIGI